MSDKGAVFSDDGLYRYRLFRIWDRNLPVVTWIMLNPSTADAETDNATIRRCVGFAKLWGYGGIEVVNVFALRATNPIELGRALDPVGPNNDLILDDIVSRAGLVVAAWGGSYPPSQKARVDNVCAFLRQRRARCLGHTRAGEPRHPVRLPYATGLVDL